VDLLARYGGEEFAVLLPGLGPEMAAAVAERLRRVVEADRDEACPRTTVSVGVASLRSHESLAALLKHADDALYRAKASGRNRTSA
jgi:diguanylate cyclase (GGDEF)-like protein